MMKPLLGTIVAGASCALILACAGGTGDTSSPLRPPNVSSRSLSTVLNVGDPGDGAPNEGEIEVCKYGTDGSFRVLVGAVQSTVNITAGTCKVVALDRSTDGSASNVAVTEVGSALYSLLSVERERIDFIANTQSEIVGSLTPVTDGVGVPVNAFHGSLFVYHNQAAAPPPPEAVCDFITFGRLVTTVNGQKVVISGNIGGNQPGGGILSEFHVEANGVDNHVADVSTYGPITSGPLSGPNFPNARMSTGIAKNGVAVEVRMWDGGEPGKGTDVVYVTLNGTVLLGPQFIDQGNMQYHSNCRGPKS